MISNGQKTKTKTKLMLYNEIDPFAYGNAIVPQLAAEFIMATMEALKGG